MATPTRTRRRLPRPARARQLLDVAEEVFAERGIASTSMDEIADRAGVTKPVLYDHFGSKDGLLAALIERGGAELTDAVAVAIAGAERPDDTLARGLNAYFSFIDNRRAAWAALTTETATNSAAASALEEIRARQARFITDVIVAEYPDAGKKRASLYAQVVIGACERLATHSATGAATSPREQTAHVMDVIWVGFAQLRAGERWG